MIINTISCRKDGQRAGRFVERFVAKGNVCFKIATYLATPPGSTRPRAYNTCEITIVKYTTTGGVQISHPLHVRFWICRLFVLFCFLLCQRNANERQPPIFATALFPHSARCDRVFHVSNYDKMSAAIRSPAARILTQATHKIPSHPPVRTTLGKVQRTTM